MAARLLKRQIESVLSHIESVRLAKTLQAHVFGEITLDRSQITAAIALLKKTVPDLTAVTLSGDPDAPITHSLVDAAYARLTTDSAPRLGVDGLIDAPSSVDMGTGVGGTPIK